MTLASTLAAASATKPAPWALTSEASCSDSSAPSTLVQAAQLITAPGRSRVISRSTLAGSVTSRSSWVERDHLVAHVLRDPDHVVAEHPVRLR